MEDLLKKIVFRTGSPTFFNSGIFDVFRTGDSTSSTGNQFADLGREFTQQFLKPGPRFNHAYLKMPAGSLNLPPHCHPGGEIATVLEGGYFDADMHGNPIQAYSKGSIVIYGNFSTHRPLSGDGAVISYTTLDGILFPQNSNELVANSAQELLGKMEKLGAQKSSLEYARSWLLK